MKADRLQMKQTKDQPWIVLEGAPAGVSQPGQFALGWFYGTATPPPAGLS